MIRLENVCKNFGDLQVLKNVNLEVTEGEKLVIIGPSVTEKGAFTDLVKTPSFYGLYLKQFCALCQAFISSNLLTLLLLSPAGYPPGYRCCSKHPRQTRIPHPAQYRCRGYCGRWGYNRH